MAKFRVTAHSINTTSFTIDTDDQDFIDWLEACDVDREKITDIADYVRDYTEEQISEGNLEMDELDVEVVDVAPVKE